MTAPFDPRLYLVTEPQAGGDAALEAIVAAAVEGGVTMVQLRDKSASGRRLLETARRLVALLAPREVPLIVNDRLDVAFAARAAGVHLGQGDLPPEAARALLGPEAVLGVSIERLDEIATIDPALVDYVAASPVFATPTKRDAAAALGLEGLRTLRRRTELPLVGIGGIHAGNVAKVVRAGADGIAVVSAITAAPDPRAAALTLRRQIDAAAENRMVQA